MEVFFPVSDEERDVLLCGAFQHPELYGLERIAWDATGVHDDAVWVAAEVDDHVAARHEDPDAKYLGYRSFTFPRDVLNRLSWRVVGADEVAAARRAEADAAEAFRRRQRGDHAACCFEAQGIASADAPPPPLVHKAALQRAR